MKSPNHDIAAPGSTAAGDGRGSDPPEARQGRLTRWRRRWRLLLILLVLLLGTAALLPTFLSQTAWGRSLLVRLWPDPRIEVQFKDLTLGWTTPVRIDSLVLTNRQGEQLAQVRRIESDIPWWRLLVARPEAIHFTVWQPEVSVLVEEHRTNFELGDRDASEQAEQTDRAARRAASLPRLHVHIIDAQVTVARSGEQPETVVPHLSLDLLLEQSGGQSWLEVEPVTLLDRVPASPALCGTGIQYVAPILARAAWIEGQLSLDLQRCRLNLRDSQQSVVEGTLSLHQVTVGPQGPILVAIRDTVSQLSQKPAITRVRMADESVVAFSLTDGVVHHSGLAFGLPEVSPQLVLQTEGNVSLDRELDMTLQVPLPFELLRNLPLAQRLGNQQLIVPITGTLDAPQLAITGDGRLASQLIGQLLNAAVAPHSRSNPATGAADDIQSLEPLPPVAGEPFTEGERFAVPHDRRSAQVLSELSGLAELVESPESAEAIGEAIRAAGSWLETVRQLRQERRDGRAASAPLGNVPPNPAGAGEPLPENDRQTAGESETSADILDGDVREGDNRNPPRPLLPRLRRFGDRLRELGREDPQ